MHSDRVFNLQPSGCPVQPVDGQQAIGVVSASGALTLSGLESKLARQAENAGASSYRIISVTGNNKLHANAEIYK